MTSTVMDTTLKRF